MTVFLIILAVLAVITIAVLSLSATVTLIYDKGWHTTVSVLFIEKEIELTKLLSFILFPEKKAQDVADADAQKKAEKESKKAEKARTTDEVAENKTDKSEKKQEASPKADGKTADEPQNVPENQEQNKPKKKNPIKDLWEREGIVGIMSLVTNLLETANSAVSTLIRGLHIYSLYVMILVGGPDADMTARAYGNLCRHYYPLKGLILATMKVDNYDDYIQPDFLAERNEAEFQLIGSINVALLLKVVFKAGFIFLKNLINNKKGTK